MDVNEVYLSKPNSEAEEAKHRGVVRASQLATLGLKRSVKDYIVYCTRCERIEGQLDGVVRQPSTDFF